MPKAPTHKEPQSPDLSDYALNVRYHWDPPYEALGLSPPKKRQPVAQPTEEERPLDKPFSISAVRGGGIFPKPDARMQPAAANPQDKPYFSDWKTIHRIHTLWDGLSAEGQHYLLAHLAERLKTPRKPTPYP
jgi:hypothetical protein